MSDFTYKLFSFWKALVNATQSWKVDMSANLRIALSDGDKSSIDLLIGTPPFPEERCEIRLAESELVTLVEQSNNLQALFLAGKVQVFGDVEQALLFSELIEHARARGIKASL